MSDRVIEVPVVARPTVHEDEGRVTLAHFLECQLESVAPKCLETGVVHGCLEMCGSFEAPGRVACTRAPIWISIS